MSVADLLVGYDAREDWLEFPDPWSAERRQSHLLRQGIVKPLSVDSDAWPSVFELVQDLVRPDWTGYVQDLWEDLEALKGAVSSADSLGARPLSWTAVELVSVTTSKTMLAVWQDRVQAVVPPRITDLNARLVGYDVADYFLLSSLTNCGASRWVAPQEWSRMKSRPNRGEVVWSRSGGEEKVVEDNLLGGGRRVGALYLDVKSGCAVRILTPEHSSPVAS